MSDKLKSIDELKLEMAMAEHEKLKKERERLLNRNAELREEVAEALRSDAEEIEDK